MEVDVVLGGDRCAIEGGGLEVPLAESGHHFFVDAVANRLQKPGLSDVALCVDGDFDDDVPLQVTREFGTRHRRVRKDDGIGYVYLVTLDGAVNHGAKRRSGASVALCSFRIRRNHQMFFHRFPCGGPWPWAGRRQRRRERKLRIWQERIFAARRRVRHAIGMFSASESQRRGRQVDRRRAMQQDCGQQSKVHDDGRGHCPMVPQRTGFWLEFGEHVVVTLS